jgi:hypothetical protein
MLTAPVPQRISRITPTIATIPQQALATPAFRPVVPPKPPDRLVFASLICGCFGFIAFFPAIILGHSSRATDATTRLHRRLGLALGYGFLIMWIVVAGYWWDRRSKGPSSPRVQSVEETTPEQPIQIPVIAEALPLLQGQISWTPLPKAIPFLASTGNDTSSLSLPIKTDLVDKFKAIRDYRSTWKRGVLVYQPQLLRVDAEPNVQDTVRFILEDCLTYTTFNNAGRDFNSTMIPRKTPVIGPFYIPQISDGLFYGRNPRLTAQVMKFNEEEFPWRMAERGVQWSIRDLPLDLQEDSSKLKWMILLKPSFDPATLVLNTREGDLLKNYSRQYTLNIFPAEVLAEVLYLESKETPVSIRLNEVLYPDNDAATAKTLIEANFKTILAHRPQEDLEIPSVFRLGSTNNTARVPVPPAPKTPVKKEPPKKSAPTSKPPTISPVDP